MLRRWIAIPLASVALLLLVGGALLFGTAEQNEDARVFVDGAMRALASKWDVNELLSRATEDFVEKSESIELESHLHRLSRLGTIKKLEHSRGSVALTFSLGRGFRVVGYFSSKVISENGTIIFRFSLVKKEGQWLISKIAVNANFSEGLEE